MQLASRSMLADANGAETLRRKLGVCRASFRARGTPTRGTMRRAGPVCPVGRPSIQTLSPASESNSVHASCGRPFSAHCTRAGWRGRNGRAVLEQGGQGVRNDPESAPRKVAGISKSFAVDTLRSRGFFFFASQVKLLEVCGRVLRRAWPTSKKSRFAFLVSSRARPPELREGASIVLMRAAPGGLAVVKKRVQEPA